MSQFKDSAFSLASLKKALRPHSNDILEDIYDNDSGYYSDDESLLPSNFQNRFPTPLKTYNAPTNPIEKKLGYRAPFFALSPQALNQLAKKESWHPPKAGVTTIALENNNLRYLLPFSFKQAYRYKPVFECSITAPSIRHSNISLRHSLGLTNDEGLGLPRSFEFSLPGEIVHNGPGVYGNMETCKEGDEVEIRVGENFTVFAWRCRCKGGKCGCKLTINGHEILRESGVLWRKGRDCEQAIRKGN
jgi:hypothetical protein